MARLIDCFVKYVDISSCSGGQPEARHAVSLRPTILPQQWDDLPDWRGHWEPSGVNRECTDGPAFVLDQS